MSTKGSQHNEETLRREDTRVVALGAPYHAARTAAGVRADEAAQGDVGSPPLAGLMPREDAEYGESYSPGIDHLPILSSDTFETLEQDRNNCTRVRADLTGAARNIQLLIDMDVTDGEFVYRILEKHPDDFRKISSVSLRYCRLRWRAFTGVPNFICVEPSDNGVFQGEDVRYEVTVMPGYGAGFILSRDALKISNWEWTGLRLVRAILAFAGFIATEQDAVGRIERWGLDERELRAVTGDDVTDEQFFEAGEMSGVGLLEDKDEAKRLLVEMNSLADFDPYLSGAFSEEALGDALLRWVEQSEWMDSVNPGLLKAANKLCAVIAEDTLTPPPRSRDADFYPDGLDAFCMSAFMLGDFPVLCRLMNQMENDMMNAGETPGMVIGADTPDELRAHISRVDRWAGATVAAIEALNDLPVADEDDAGNLDA